MQPPPFPELLAQSSCILGEGAVIERLRRDAGADLDPYLVNSAFIYDDAKRAALETICRQYLDDSAALVEEDPQVFGRTVAALHRDLGMKILGGCCGTDDRHIRSLASRLAAEQRSPA